MFSLCLSLNWIYLSDLTEVPDENRSPGWVMTAVYVVNMISRAMCSKVDQRNWIEFMFGL